MKITVYNEFNIHHKSGKILEAYPNGIHGSLKKLFEENGHEIRTYTLETINDITLDVLKDTDVLVWWGHMNHNDVKDEVVDMIVNQVNLGMGFIALHSSHLSKPLKRLLGTPCTLQWREMDENERLWVVNPTHPIAKGLPSYIDIPHDEMYGEPFAIPTPDELVFIGWFKGGNVFRSGCCYNRGYGKVFYFQPGHETNPVYEIPEIKKILLNAIEWAKPTTRLEYLDCPNATNLLEKI